MPKARWSCCTTRRRAENRLAIGRQEVRGIRLHDRLRGGVVSRAEPGPVCSPTVVQGVWYDAGHELRLLLTLDQGSVNSATKELSVVAAAAIMEGVIVMLAAGQIDEVAAAEAVTARLSAARLTINSYCDAYPELGPTRTEDLVVQCIDLALSNKLVDDDNRALANELRHAGLEAPSVEWAKLVLCHLC